MAGMYGISPPPDERLSLIFACCHPGIEQSAQVALTLHSLSGLNTREIAAGFLIKEATVSQRIVRAKRKIKAAREEMKEKGANILLDERFKGKIAGWSDWRTRIWYASLQTGQDPNGATDMDAIWEAVRAHRDLLLKYWSSGAELMSLLAEEEIYVTEAWSGRVYALQEQGHDIGYMDPPNGFGWQEWLSRATVFIGSTVVTHVPSRCWRVCAVRTYTQWWRRRAHGVEPVVCEQQVALLAH